MQHLALLPKTTMIKEALRSLEAYQLETTIGRFCAGILAFAYAAETLSAAYLLLPVAGILLSWLLTTAIRYRLIKHGDD